MWLITLLQLPLSSVVRNKRGGGKRIVSLLLYSIYDELNKFGSFHFNCGALGTGHDHVQLSNCRQAIMLTHQHEPLKSVFGLKSIEVQSQMGRTVLEAKEPKIHGEYEIWCVRTSPFCLLQEYTGGKSKCNETHLNIFNLRKFLFSFNRIQLNTVNLFKLVYCSTYGINSRLFLLIH